MWDSLVVAVSWACSMLWRQWSPQPFHRVCSRIHAPREGGFAGRGIVVRSRSFRPRIAEAAPLPPETRMVADEIELLDRENALLELERIVARVRDHGRHELHYGTSPAANPPAAKPSLVDRLRSPPSAANVEKQTCGVKERDQEEGLKI